MVLLGKLHLTLKKKPWALMFPFNKVKVPEECGLMFSMFNALLMHA